MGILTQPESELGMDVLLFAALSFLLASIPFSLLIGRIFANRDIRDYGDGNPGATNVYRATHNRALFALAAACDSLKGTLSVGIAWWVLGWQDERIVPVALLAIAGHVFSPFLRFNGGKAVAITGGVWAAITLWEIPIVMGILITFWVRSVEESNWAVMLTMLSVGLYLVIAHRAHPVFMAIWAGNALLLWVRHRHGLATAPTLKWWLPFVKRRL